MGHARVLGRRRGGSRADGSAGNRTGRLRGRYVVGGTGDSVELRIEDSALRFEESYGDHSAISETNPELPPPARAGFYADRMVLIDGP